MSKFFWVEITYTALVQADSADAAAEVAEDELRDIQANESDPSIWPAGEVTHLGQLSAHGWDGMCLPYGGDGSARLKDLLPAAASLAKQEAGHA